MKADVARYWYTHIQNIVKLLDDMNTGDAQTDLMYVAVNEAIRRAAQEGRAYTEDITATAEMPAVEWSEAS